MNIRYKYIYVKNLRRPAEKPKLIGAVIDKAPGCITLVRESIKDYRFWGGVLHMRLVVECRMLAKSISFMPSFEGSVFPKMYEGKLYFGPDQWFVPKKDRDSFERSIKDLMALLRKTLGKCELGGKQQAELYSREGLHFMRIQKNLRACDVVERLRLAGYTTTAIAYGRIERGETKVTDPQVVRYLAAALDLNEYQTNMMMSSFGLYDKEYVDSLVEMMRRRYTHQEFERKKLEAELDGAIRYAEMMQELNTKGAKELEKLKERFEIELNKRLDKLEEDRKREEEQKASLRAEWLTEMFSCFGKDNEDD